MEIYLNPYLVTTSGSGTNIANQLAWTSGGNLTDWSASAVKAEPDDEFTWLRKRVNEITESAFA